MTIFQRVGLISSISAAMFVFAFALVPLYDVFCDVTGLNGKTKNDPQSPYQAVYDENREITVEFLSYVKADFPWEFEPSVNRMTVSPGKTYALSYFAKNNAKIEQVGQAVPSVSPGEGAGYFNKIACFCFDRQPLLAGAEAELGMTFYIDPAIPKDIHTLTLAYTLFEAPELAEEDNPS
jgi:cytochrome c oxidase assembly protein subunit 11